MPAGKKEEVLYDCNQCTGLCCGGVYERVEVESKDIVRLANHLNMAPELVVLKYLQLSGEGDEIIIKRRNDKLMGKACVFLDNKTRRCTVYEGRPDTCRDYPGQPRCPYYDLLVYERDKQADGGEDIAIAVNFELKVLQPR